MQLHPGSPGVQGCGLMTNIHLLGNLAVFALPMSETKRGPQQKASGTHPGTRNYPPGIPWPRPLVEEVSSEEEVEKVTEIRPQRGSSKSQTEDPELEDRSCSPPLPEPCLP